MNKVVVLMAGMVGVAFASFGWSGSAQAGADCGGEASGHYVARVADEIALGSLAIFRAPSTLAVSLCEDGTADGGGMLTLVYDGNFVDNLVIPNADQLFEIGDPIKVSVEPVTWVDHPAIPAPLIRGTLRPIGQTRLNVLRLGGTEALEGWEFNGGFFANFATGAYDLNGDGIDDLIVNYIRH